jgi:cytochrome c oxidase cbb3-type subunit 1
MLILFGSWGGIPVSAPVPAWMPAVSVVASALGVIPVAAVALNVHRTLEGKCSQLMRNPSLHFIGFGLIAFVLSGLASALTALPAVNQVTQFTWFTVGSGLLNSYGFFVMVIFGAIYYIVPQLTGREFPLPRLVQAHCWTAAVGVLLFALPLAIGGIAQGLKLQHADMAFTDIARGTLPMLRVSTIGDLLMALGHVMFFMNLGGLVFQFYRARAVSAWAEATAEVKAAETRP